MTAMHWAWDNNSNVVIRVNVSWWSYWLDSITTNVIVLVIEEPKMSKCQGS